LDRRAGCGKGSGGATSSARPILRSGALDSLSHSAKTCCIRKERCASSSLGASLKPVGWDIWSASLSAEMECEIESLYIDAAYREQGIGGELMRRILEQT